MLGADWSDDPGLMELCAPLIAAWARAANGPDIPLTRWLGESAPAGIERHPECVGAFPPAYEPSSWGFAISPK